MNIFILDLDPIKCARYHCDKHVIKMLLEAAQMLCTVSWLYGYKVPYKPTHNKHPCTLWLTESIENWRWLIRLSGALNLEYRYRFGHNLNHKSYDVIQTLLTPNLPRIARTPFAEVMPGEYKKSANTVIAYRRFYVAEKRFFCKWTKRNEPRWFVQGVNNLSQVRELVL